MALVDMREMLAKAYKGGYAVGGYNGWDSISALAVLEECQAKKSPALMICAPAEYQALGANGVTEVVRVLSDMRGMDACIHLDHSPTFEDCVEAIEAGFKSVMVDGSRLPFEENVALTRKVVEYAHPRGVCVEAELGAVGRVDTTSIEGGGEGNVFTDPAEAAKFVKETDCDFLAVSIGNAHGLYVAAPTLDFDILAKIRAAISIPLVLHGGSGTPEDQLKKAVSMGMAKVNVASEIGQAFNKTYVERAIEAKEWWAIAKAGAKVSMRKVIARWIGMLGTEGKA